MYYNVWQNKCFGGRRVRLALKVASWNEDNETLHIQHSLPCSFVIFWHRHPFLWMEVLFLKAAFVTSIYSQCFFKKDLHQFMNAVQKYECRNKGFPLQTSNHADLLMYNILHYLNCSVCIEIDCIDIYYSEQKHLSFKCHWKSYKWRIQFKETTFKINTSDIYLHANNAGFFFQLSYWIGLDIQFFNFLIF